MTTTRPEYPVLVPKHKPVDIRCYYPRLLPATLPIEGGWGYTIDDAIVITGGDLYATEMTFIGFRNQYDLLVTRCRPVDHSLVRIKWTFETQALVHDQGRVYDVISGSASGVPNHLVFTQLESLADLGAMGPLGEDPSRFVRWDGERIHVHRDFWFDITPVYGQN